jgi:hypothetical protein
MAEPLCKNKFYDHVCQMILFSLYSNKHIKLQELRNTVDGMLQSNTALDDDSWRACMKILNDKGLGAKHMMENAPYVSRNHWSGRSEALM